MIRIGVRSFVSAGGGTDADAQAFITAAGITDATQQSAINTLVTDLKGYGIWSKMKAIYPFVGGTATTHKWNLKDPRDLDAAFRLVFSGGSTHSSTGWLPNGTNGYADTKLNPSISTTNNNVHLSYYSRTNIEQASSSTMGADTYTSNSFLRLVLKRPTNTGFLIAGSSTAGILTYTITNSTGLFINNVPNSSTRKLFRNNTLLTPTTTGALGTNTTSNTSIFLGSYSQTGIASEFDNKECAFASIGDGLTDTEAANLYTAVQAYQTTLSRNV